MKKTFTKIPNEWGIKEFDLTSRFLVAQILGWQNNGLQFKMKRKTFCNNYGITPYQFDKALAKMISCGIIIEEMRLPKNIGVYKIDKVELQKCLADTTNFKRKKCTTVDLEVKNRSFTSEEVAPLLVQPEHHSKTRLDTRLFNKLDNRLLKGEEDNFFDTIDINDYKFKKTI